MEKVLESFLDTSYVVTKLKLDYPVYCFRSKILETTTQKFINLFPGNVLYAVKCNPHPLVIEPIWYL